MAGALSRRKLLKAAAAVTVFQALNPVISPARSRGRNVIIVGAGMSGLAAAADLQKKGFGVVVLEGGLRIGGRIFTDSLGGQPVDLGAQWIEGTSGNPIYQLAKQLKIETTVSDYNSVDAYDITGARWRDNTFNAIESAVIAKIGQTESLLARLVRKRQLDITMADALRQVGLDSDLDPRNRRFIQYVVGNEIETNEAEFTDYLSLSNYWAENEPNDFAGDNVVFPGGYEQLIQYLAKGIDVRLGQKVKSITYDSRGVALTTSSDTFSASHCLVTVPLGVLQSGSIQFTPPLPADKLAAINAIRMGVANKVVLRFERQFWPDEHFFGYTSDIRGQFVEWTNVGKYTGAPILSLWSDSDTARNMEHLTDQQVTASAVAVIKKIWGNSVSSLTGSLVTRWGSNPLSFGSYSTMPLGATFDHFDTLAKPLMDHLFFAGEATSRGHHATVHGAYLSGLRESQRIAGT